MRASKGGAIGLALLMLVPAACTANQTSSSSDVSPTSEQVVIRLGTGDPRGRPDTPVVERFADAVEQLSGGGIKVDVVWEAGGNSADPDGFERGVVALVQEDALDLGWVATRVWDTLGVTSFQALQAPFLITDQELLAEVLASPTADEMIAGLDDAGVVGLGLFPDGLRYPLGYAAPMASVEGFDGAAIRLVPSEATEAVIRALGGRPVYGLAGDELDAAISSGDIDGTEISLALAPSIAQDVAPAAVITGNLVLFPRVNTLFAGPGLMSSLSDGQWSVLVAATAEAQAFAAQSVIEDGRSFCVAGGEFVNASETDLVALHRAVQPVYRMLGADPETKMFIDDIQESKEEQAVTDASPSCSAG